MANKDQVIAINRANPHWCDLEIARELDCAPAYVRAVANHYGLYLAPRRPPTSRSDVATALSKAIDGLLRLETREASTTMRARANAMAAFAMASFERLQGWRHD